MLHAIAYDAGIRSLDDIPKSREANDIYTALQENEVLIKQLGYREAPKELYQQLMAESEFKGRTQAAKGVDGTRKRSLFIKTN